MFKNYIQASVLVSAAALVAMPMVGCQTYERDDQATVSGAPMSVVPDAAKNAFRKDHPNASLTNVEQQPASTGQMLYKFVYITNGDAGQAIYHGDGRRVSPN
ncbi:MAG TPA: hypothetical protein VGN72_11185 [Tepidisphaeraceae bacterium]|jgi:hypothetical protein|nr:hypothetical protein [Tepidisphaeraceae bacterium]